jgi:hypothetical protein
MVRKDKTQGLGQVGETTKANTRGQLYEIKWLDAYEMESGWQTLEDALKITPPEVSSVGYVLKETKEYIILAADIGSDKMDNDVGRVTVIPGQWIVEIKIII